MIRHQPLFNTTPIESHAIVIGGSIAGMFAARVLSNYFTQITVIDHDTFSDAPAHHKGAPHHVHGLLARGHMIIKQLFPSTIPFSYGGLGVGMGWTRSGLLTKPPKGGGVARIWLSAGDRLALLLTQLHQRGYVQQFDNRHFFLVSGGGWCCAMCSGSISYATSWSQHHVAGTTKPSLGAYHCDAAWWRKWAGTNMLNMGKPSNGLR
ncbi:MAG: hypothetical protein GFH27_549309n8 [Chloroflexi bacterium AL-W]|nr:hypothetical protein [Chloroflexi bacterium AL-N1]NOK69711.1 hypothetical protein [Chloroflexi bacterium AL-N10]NOK73685.1 hypothetical protein [Chloroflexi bacterium AL-N5]NOK83881.1 hypothetical protein [Chloroflexi bacterium AL-W]NOK88016.1 hypothetical protein [Chloroflexi bacterium AL-N15]